MRLTETRTGAILWFDRWSGPAQDIFTVQDEILSRIGGTLDGSWTGAIARFTRAGLAGQGTRNLDAYELYLLGVEAKHRFTTESYREAAAYLRRAIAADPGYAKAHSALGIVLMFRILDASTEAEAFALMDEASAAFRKAVALDPDDPDALVQLASAQLWDGRRAEAKRSLDRAIELAPNNPDVLSIAAWTYPWADSPALDRARLAMERNPGHPDYYHVGLALAALFAGDFALARQEAKAAPPVPDAVVALGAAEAHLGDMNASRTAFEAFLAQTSFRRLGLYYGTPDIAADPLWANLVEGARLAAYPSPRMRHMRRRIRCAPGTRTWRRWLLVRTAPLPE
ncbi:tetratricopeptide repeat protein [Cereibacter sphaeroides]|uniref:tetratricopeptide repeat protein n=1 Tax=Cereibacter sphaeroides TaxID=1063 RepID=UPI001F1A7F5E|nr:tetratricopeptide repeat protein [Cereibacter sphaeroides]MCE6949924.1 tetratricopeptide repeat protein [Cereibacter sphaeroides]